MQDSLLNYNTYQALQRATEHILSTYPKSYAYSDYMRGSLAHNALKKLHNKEKVTQAEEKAYLTKSLFPLDGTQLTPEQFERLYTVYGEATSKIRILDHNVSSWLVNAPTQQQFLNVGGACALESVDTKIIMYLQQQTKNKDLVKDYVTRMLQCFPTWTQITGTIIPGEGLSVMYDETYPWYLRLKEYGIPDAKTITQQIYDDIFIRVRRFVKLHNPNNKIIKIPFTKLDLVNKGHIEEWFELCKPYLEFLDEKYGKVTSSYDLDSYHKAWIEYTYFGPRILDLDLEIIKEMYPDKYEAYNLDKATIHVRSKQIDHLDIERIHPWMHGILLENYGSKKVKANTHLLQQPFYRLGLAMYMWMRDHFKDHKSVGFSGFLDSTFKGVLLHEDHFHSRSEIKKTIISGDDDSFYNCPLRLHAQNYKEVLIFLERFKNPNSVSVSKNTMISLVETRSSIKKLEKKIKAVSNIISFYEEVATLLTTFSLTLPKKVSATYIQQMKDMLQQRYHSNKYLRNQFGKDFTSIKFTELLSDVFSTVILEHVKNSSVISISTSKHTTEFITVFGEVINKYIVLDSKRLESLHSEKKELESKLKYYSQVVVNDITEFQNDDLSKYVQILPLADNLFVTYMQQLLFIPSVRNAYLDMVNISQNQKIGTQEREEMIIEIIQKIFPVVTSAISYVFRGGDYPWKERFEYQYRSNF